MNTLACTSSSIQIKEEFFLLLGLALYSAQSFQFALYGLASHMSHLPEAKKDKRFANFNPNDFLSADPEKKALRKATLGQLCTLFGDRLLISGDDLDQLIKDRNLIVHDFWRETNTIRGVIGISDPNDFLRNFISRMENFKAAINGLLSHLIDAASKKENRSDEFSITDADSKNRQAFELILAVRVIKNITNSIQNPVQPD